MQVSCLYSEDYLHAVHNGMTSLNSTELFMKKLYTRIIPSAWRL